MNETQVTLVGTITSDLRRRNAGDGGAELVSFRVAANERRRDRESGEWHDGETTYAQVTCWRRLVGGVSFSLYKGAPVIVTGRMFTRQYEVDGAKRSSLEIDAAAVGPDLARCQATIMKPPQRAAAAEQDGDGADAGSLAAVGAGLEVPDSPEELTAR